MNNTPTIIVESAQFEKFKRGEKSIFISTTIPTPEWTGGFLFKIASTLSPTKTIEAMIVKVEKKLPYEILTIEAIKAGYLNLNELFKSFCMKSISITTYVVLSHVISMLGEFNEK